MTGMGRQVLRRMGRLRRMLRPRKNRGLSSSVLKGRQRRSGTRTSWTMATGTRRTARAAIGTKATARMTRRGRAVRGVAVIQAVPRGVVGAVPVVVGAVRVRRVAAVLLAVTAARPDVVNNSIRRSISASASWTSAHGMRVGVSGAGRRRVQSPSWALAAAATASGVKPK